MPTRTAHRTVGCIVGVFDLFHIGHLDQLLTAAAGFDDLVVAIPSDDLIESLTGERPFVPQIERAEILSAVRCVSRVEVLETLDLGPLVRNVGVRTVLLPAETLDDFLANSLADSLSDSPGGELGDSPADGVQLHRLESRRSTRSGAVLAALQRKRGGHHRGDLDQGDRSNVA